ncbi:MAG: DUF3343 domain-containing protein [Armatimonadetes bacterium]|nr:DUF3343 domain-containing protein [Armatimonadota bacterium]
MKYVLFTFERAHDAMEAAAALGEAGVEGGQLIPRPKTLSANCGVALRVPADKASRAVAVLGEQGLLDEVYVSSDGRQWQAARAEELSAGAPDGGHG